MDVSRNFTNREVCEFYYVKDPAGPKPDSNDKDKLKLKWTCDCGNCVKLVAEGSGYSNLMDHITRDHPDYLDVMRASTQFEDKSIAKFMIKNPITSKANWIYSWLEWVVMGNHTFSFCEAELTKKNTKLRHMSIKTLLIYMKHVSDALVEIITKEMKEATSPIGLVFDGWSDGRATHYCGIFSQYLSSTGLKREPLLACASAFEVSRRTMCAYSTHPL